MSSDGASRQPGPWTALGADAVLDGRYRLIRLLGRGGMADVWAAEDGVLGRPVAVKIFRFDTPGADQDRIETEMRTLAQLSHPGIINIYDAGTVADPGGIEGARMPYLVMELVEGQTLADRLAHGPLSGTEATGLGAQLADTLDYLHRQGVVHRDVKPANILLHSLETPQPTAALRARLTDFGIARLVDSTRITEIGTTVGTANYLSPEQATGAAVGPPSDIYSLGLVLLEALTGQVAYPGSGVPAAAARLHRAPHVPDTLDPHWAALLTAMTTTDPDDRPAANDVAAELGRIGTPLQADATRVITGSTTLQTSATRQLPTANSGARVRGRRRHPRWSKPAMWAALVGVAIVVVVVAVLATERGSRSPAPETTNPPEYPAVSGQIGQHLRQLEGVIG